MRNSKTRINTSQSISCNRSDWCWRVVSCSKVDGGEFVVFTSCILKDLDATFETVSALPSFDFSFKRPCPYTLHSAYLFYKNHLRYPYTDDTMLFPSQAVRALGTLHCCCITSNLSFPACLTARMLPATFLKAFPDNLPLLGAHDVVAGF
jgi:hypothetical protein